MESAYCYRLHGFYVLSPASPWHLVVLQYQYKEWPLLSPQQACELCVFQNKWLHLAKNLQRNIHFVSQDCCQPQRCHHCSHLSFQATCTRSVQCNLKGSFVVCLPMMVMFSFGTNRCIHSSHPLGEHVFVLSVIPPVVSHLLCFCIRSVVADLLLPCISCSRVMAEWPLGLAGVYP